MKCNYCRQVQLFSVLEAFYFQFSLRPAGTSPVDALKVQSSVCSYRMRHFEQLTQLVASFQTLPDSPSGGRKSGKKTGESGKIYHVRNVIGRENLITCGQTNELAHTLWC